MGGFFNDLNVFDLLEEADSFTANPLHVRQGVVPVNSNGVEFHSSDDNFGLIVPKTQLSVERGRMAHYHTGPRVWVVEMCH